MLLPILSGEKDNAEEKIENHEEKSLDGIGAILSMQLFPQHHNIKSAFGEFMVSKKAQGYLFGFHDAWARTVNKLSSAKAVEFMGESYSRLFGISSAQCLITNVLGLQDDEDFISGRDEGAEDCLSFLRNGRQPLGLSRIFMFSKKDDHKRDAVGPWG
ncbi:MAG: hypothetical protein GC185_05455 [Alphaproteobacteria bacterium]|nr:hypothetical protein [Alphaproteobacteria bacterium]